VLNNQLYVVEPGEKRAVGFNQVLPNLASIPMWRRGLGDPLSGERNI